MSREEQFPIEEQAVRQFIEENKKRWTDVPHNGKYIYINLSMVRMQIAWLVPKLLFAKGLQEKTGAKPVAITWRGNPLLTDFFKSFGIEHIILDDICKKSFSAFWKASWKTGSFLLLKGSGEELKKLRACGVLVGLGLYEDILRTSSLSTLKSCRNKVCFKKMLHILWSVYGLESQLKKQPIQFAVTDDMAYHEGVFIQLFRHNNAKIYANSNVGVVKVSFDASTGDIRRYPVLMRERFEKEFPKLDNEAIAWTERFLEERFRGKNGREIDRQAFAGKKVLSREEMIQLLHLDPDKKNVVIMAHTFTDAVFNYGLDYYFRDYYDWTEQTLKIASTVDNVNWVLKPHPTRSSYNESEDSIEDMFARYHKPNMFLLPDEISGESIKNIADVVITIGGNAGAEYACFGIPAVIVGKPYYHGWGFTIEPKNPQEYKEALSSLNEMQRLSDKQIETAKKLFFLQNNKDYHNPTLYRDEFADMINSKYTQMQEKMALQYFKNNDGTATYNTEILNLVREYANYHDMKETAYYQRGVELANKEKEQKG